MLSCGRLPAYTIFPHCYGEARGYLIDHRIIKLLYISSRFSLVLFKYRWMASCSWATSPRKFLLPSALVQIHTFVVLCWALAQSGESRSTLAPPNDL
jgi:hypothetical protein